jgi:hypothetical protein
MVPAGYRGRNQPVRYVGQLASPVFAVGSRRPCRGKLESVGIRTYGDFEKLGWEKTIAVYTRAHPHRLNNIVCWGFLGALLNIPYQQMPEELKEKGKALCAKLKKERR